MAVVNYLLTGERLSPLFIDQAITQSSAELLTDFRPSNGSTEFWLGSHNQTLPIEQVWKTADAIVPTCNIRQELLDERRKTRPPIQVEVPFGCLLLRDPRTWHAGMPNPSEEDRTMIALGE